MSLYVIIATIAVLYFYTTFLFLCLACCLLFTCVVLF